MRTRLVTFVKYLLARDSIENLPRERICNNFREIKKNCFEEETLIEKIYLFHVIIIIENSKRGEKKFLSYERDDSKMFLRGKIG